MKKICDFFCDFRNLGLLVAALSAVALAFAWTMEYGFNRLPCHLCLVQRKPYILAFIFGVLAALAARKFPRASFVLLMYGGIAFLSTLGVAAFHFGTEQGWWPLLTGCMQADPPDPNFTMEELMEYFRNRPIVRCDVPGWSFLGLSMTGWNFLYALGCSAFTIFHAITGRRNAEKTQA